MYLVALYLAAVVAANLLIAAFGPAAAVPVALVLIGATLTVRDRLHDGWQGRRQGLPWKMGALILTGAVLSWAINRGAARIAAASFAAFVVSESVDTIVYSLLRRRPWMVRATGSNIVAAAADSFLFPTLAFGALLWAVILGQFVAKTVGGTLWAAILGRRRRLAPPSRREV